MWYDTVQSVVSSCSWPRSSQPLPVICSLLAYYIKLTFQMHTVCIVVKYVRMQARTMVTV